MKGCSLFNNKNWPVIFCSDDSVSAIVDDYIIKKFALIDEANNV